MGMAHNAPGAGQPDFAHLTAAQGSRRTAIQTRLLLVVLSFDNLIGSRGQTLRARLYAEAKGVTGNNSVGAT
jgi:hypothetical protein